jgi:hypothetical protein
MLKLKEMLPALIHQGLCHLEFCFIHGLSGFSPGFEIYFSGLLSALLLVEETLQKSPAF